MNFQIDGTNTINKGAELMLHAVLEQIEARYPNSKVHFNAYSRLPKHIKTSLNIYKRPLLNVGKYPEKILRKFGFPLSRFTSLYPLKEIDVLFDASGFRFGDQWTWKHTPEYLDRYEYYLKKHKQSGTKIYFLPQAFGPFKTDSGKRSAEILDKYADYIFAREKISYNHLKSVGVNRDKLEICTDFTNIVKANVACDFLEINGRVCIIPNRKMLTKTSLKSTEYIDLYNTIINQVEEFGLEVYLLNHEGKGDLDICKKIVERVNNNIPIVTDEDPRKIKNIIGKSYAVISSRFHGVASALSQGVPCLATSWSHKYEMLFKDYDLSSYILKVDDNQNNKDKILSVIDKESNSKLRKHLSKKINVLEEEVKGMWKSIWSRI